MNPIHLSFREIMVLAACLAVAPAHAQESPPVPAPAAPAAKTEAKTPAIKTCPVCNGTGTLNCNVPGCQNGKMRCPNPCLKLDEGRWERKDVPGHPPTDLWRFFPNQKTGGDTTGHFWNQAHVGEIIEYRNGLPENVGKCPVCQGATKIPCPACKGTTKLTCWGCNGTKTLSILPETAPFLDPSGMPDPAICLSVVEVVQKPFPFFFSGVSEGAAGVKYTITRVDGAQAYAVKLQEVIPDPQWQGYKVVQFNEKFDERPDPTIKGADGKPYMVKVDAAELVLEKEPGRSIVLVKGRKSGVPSGEYAAKIHSRYENRVFNAEKGTSISLLGKTYEVIQVKPADGGRPEVIIKRQDTGREFRLPLGSKGA